MTTDRWKVGLSVVLGGVFLSNLLRTIVWPDPAIGPWDFVCFWTAGHAWSLGALPYDLADPANMPPDDYMQWPFVYPPAIRLLFEPFGRLPFELSWQLYKVLQVMMWACVCVLTTRHLPRSWPTPVRVAGMPFLIGVMSYPAYLSTGSGQVVAFLAAALALLMSLPDGRRSWVRVGIVLCVLSLKPHLGMPLAIVVIARWGSWRAVALASAIVGGLTLWGCDFRPDIALPLFLDNLAGYNGSSPNVPGRMSGLPAAFAAMGLPSPSGLVLALAALVPASLAAFSGLRRDRALLLAMVCMFAIEPNHEHAYLLMLPLVGVMLDAPRTIRAVYLGAVAVLAQSMTVGLAAAQSGIDGHAVFVGIDTVVVFTLAGVTLIWLWPDLRRRSAGDDYPSPALDGVLALRFPG